MANSTPRPTFFTSFFSAFRAGQKYAPMQPKSQPVSTATSATTATATQSLSQSMGISSWVGSASWESASGGSNLQASSPPQAIRDVAGGATQMLPTRQSSPGPTSPRSIPFARPPSPQMHDSISGFTRQQRSRTPSETRMGQGHRRSSELHDSPHSGLANATGGFRTGFGRHEDPLGAQNWYVGGRTAAGEERFYKLGMVRRYNSQDRLSLDRLSI